MVGSSLFLLPLTDNYFPQIRRNTRQWKMNMKKSRAAFGKNRTEFVPFPQDMNL
jgi:hypothetical protein